MVRPLARDVPGFAIEGTKDLGETVNILEASMKRSVVERRLSISALSKGLRRVFLSGLGLGWLVLLVITMMAPFGAKAQLSGKGEITGLVTDKTGAVIPGAVIAVTNTATGITVKTTSTGAGNFIFPDLDPGIYSIVTTPQSLEKLLRENVDVNAFETQT